MDYFIHLVSVRKTPTDNLLHGLVWWLGLHCYVSGYMLRLAGVGEGNKNVDKAVCTAPITVALLSKCRRRC